MRYLLIMGFLLGFTMLSFESVYATPFTPLEWQRRVEKPFHDDFVGQRKHTTWVRDHRNRNFIDDIIDERLEKKVDKFDIIVDLNTFLTKDGSDYKKLAEYGDVKYVGKMITFIYLNNVAAKNLFKIAKMGVVAMIEIQQDFQPALDVSARAIQAKSCLMCPDPWQTCPPWETAANDNLSGSGINIAIIDTGVDDCHEQFDDKDDKVDDCPEKFGDKFVAGFDATIFEDTDHNGVDDSGDEPGNGKTNPDDDWNEFGSEGHGTHVAGIALGKGSTQGNRYCRAPDGESSKCDGVAPGAGLVDIKVCANDDCTNEDMAEALDWLGFNYDRFDIRVANISLACDPIDKNEDGIIENVEWDDDGKSAIAQQVNYLSALGIVMVVAHGNAIGLPTELNRPNTRLTQTPGSASFAVTVSGTNDMGTVTRIDDENYDRFLVGPRKDFEPSAPNILALKPDISAPGQTIYSAKHDNPPYQYRENSGTSMAAPHVSGAAAIILEAKDEMNPGSVKHALIQSADKSHNPPAEYSNFPNWDKAFGWGMLNVKAAIDLVAATDVGFPTCSGPPNNPGRPCALSGGLPRWNNNQDISTPAPPQEGVANEIHVKVENTGTSPVEVLVNFGVYIFAVGNNRFFHIGTKEVEVPGNSIITVPHPWIPESADHQCIQVSIDYGFDTNFDNNVTQRNLQVAPSNFTLRVENPFPVPAEFVVRPISQHKGWDCIVDKPKFRLHPFLDPPEIVQITFDAPKDAKPGEMAYCDVAVYATTMDEEKEDVLIGGVTVKTFVPKPCRIIGWIRDKGNRPISGAKVILNTERQPIKAESDEYGFVSFEGTPYRPQKITVISKEYGEQSTKEPVRLYCGAGTFEILVTEKGLIIENNRRQKDWAWDSQVREGYEFKRKNKL